MTFLIRRPIVAAAIVGLLIASASTADAKLLKLAKAQAEDLPPIPGPAVDGPALFGTPVPAQGPIFAPGPIGHGAAYGTGASYSLQPMPVPEVVVPAKCIKYRNAIFDFKKVKCCNPCLPPIQAVLHVTNPCTCCPLDVPVCLPNCCCDAPKIECRKTLLGDGVVTYSWCCGFSASIRFQPCGDVLVTYRGN